MFYFKQFSLAWVRILNVKTVLFKIIHFSVSIQFISLWPIDKTLSGGTTPNQNRPGSDGKKGYFAFLKSPALLEPYHQIVSCHIQDTCCGEILLLCRDAVGAFCSSSWQGHRILVGRVLPFDRDSVGKIYSPMLFVYRFVFFNFPTAVHRNHRIQEMTKWSSSWCRRSIEVLDCIICRGVRKKVIWVWN